MHKVNMQFIAFAGGFFSRKLPVTSGWFVSRTTSGVPLEEANVKYSLLYMSIRAGHESEGR